MHFNFAHIFANLRTQLGQYGSYGYHAPTDNLTKAVDLRVLEVLEHIIDRIREDVTTQLHIDRDAVSRPGEANGLIIQPTLSGGGWEVRRIRSDRAAVPLTVTSDDLVRTIQSELAALTANTLTAAKPDDVPF